MKKIFIFIVVLFSALVILPKQISAQGTCGCIVGEYGTCGLKTNGCSAGYTPSCTNDRTQCNTNASSCTCTPTASVGNKLNCGHKSEDCCPGSTCATSDLTCTLTQGSHTGNAYKCLDSGQIQILPGTKPDTSTSGLDVTCNNKTGIKTAIGCIPVLGSTDDFLAAVLKWAVGIGGGIAFALMLYAGFMLMTAQGNPERMKAGQELLTSAVAGLILLIFSIFILKFIGVDILGLQKFGFGQ